MEAALPQSPSTAVLDEFDDPDRIHEYVQRLGNLALIEQPINRSVGNRRYTLKRGEYAKSRFLLTKSLGTSVDVGSNTSITRATRNLEEFETWSTSAIDRRQLILKDLAHAVWEMPKQPDPA
jgi:hypothetical protein